MYTSANDHWPLMVPNFDSKVSVVQQDKPTSLYFSPALSLPLLNGEISCCKKFMIYQFYSGGAYKLHKILNRQKSTDNVYVLNSED